MFYLVNTPLGLGLHVRSAPCRSVSTLPPLYGLGEVPRRFARQPRQSPPGVELEAPFTEPGVIWKQTFSTLSEDRHLEPEEDESCLPPWLRWLDGSGGEETVSAGTENDETEMQEMEGGKLENEDVEDGEDSG
jgi:hypothetical protein